ncbi:MAG: phenylalanine--tRNA ligase subunit beta, partial [Planctomycetota bacterium]
SKAAFLHPGKSATLFSGDSVLGDFGQLHPSIAEQLGLGERQIFVADFDLTALQSARPPRFSYAPVARFPAALRDVAIVIDDAIAGEKIVTEIKAAGGELLQGVRLFDVYRGEGIPEGKKSLAFALAYQAGDRTLTDKEIDKAHKKIEDRLKHTLKALIRGKDCT